MSSVLRDDDHLSRVRATKQNTLTHCASISGQAPVFFLISNKTCHSRSKAKLVRKNHFKGHNGTFLMVISIYIATVTLTTMKKKMEATEASKKACSTFKSG